MWIVAEIKRRQLNRDEIFTMHTVIKQGVRVIFQYHLFPRVPLKSLVILSIRSQCVFEDLKYSGPSIVIHVVHLS